MSNERRDGLDSILDAALRDYSNREPRTEFEQRILGRIHSRPPVRRSLWRTGWALIPVLLAVIAAIAITAGHERRKVQPHPDVARVMPLPAPAPIPLVATVATRHTKLPRRERLPEPETLTDGERALLNFARTNPEQAHELVADSGQIKDLTIDPLKIEALP